MDRVELEAPAKLNLGLRIVGRRADGYHLLESVFVPVDLHDDVQLEAGPGDAIDLELAPGDADPALTIDVPTDHRNLAVRAARAFLDRAGRSAAIRIALRKRIPSAAGLGGGSSDAGAVLRGLARLFPDDLAPEALADVAARLGADVPFFLDPRPAVVTGIGEHREALGDWPELVFVLANPRVDVATADVFRGRAEGGTAFAPQGDLAAAIAGLRAAGFGPDRPAWARLLENDLAPAAEALCPAMRDLRSALERQGALASAQSGSGATVFGVFAGRTAAERAVEGLSVNDSGWFRVAVSPGAR